MSVTKPTAPAKRPSKKAAKAVVKSLAAASTVSKSTLVPVFVYGSLKQGYPLHEYYLEGQELIGAACITGYTMISLGNYPALIATGNSEHAVSGEYYLVSMESYEAMKSMEERAGYKTISVEGKFSSRQNIPALNGTAFKARAWAFPTQVGTANWAKFLHERDEYHYVDYHDETKKDDKP